MARTCALCAWMWEGAGNISLWEATLVVKHMHRYTCLCANYTSTRLVCMCPSTRRYMQPIV